MSRPLNREEWLDTCADLAKIYEQAWEEADATEQKLHDFKQKVSDAVTALLDRFLGDSLSQGVINGHLHQFIIPATKPDPLVEVLTEISGEGGFDNFDHYAHRLRAALDALGFEIREKNDDQ
jgi:hypothetical protein